MRRNLVILVLALALGCVGPSISGPTARPLTVVELFTSQGCSSCPPANENLAILARRDDVLALSFGVTYWDYLGWRDIFASPAFTERQRDYAKSLHLRAVYTPQMVINGRVDTVGNRLGNLNDLLRRTPRIGESPSISANVSSVTISGIQGQTSPATIWLVRYDPRLVQVPIKRGENGGKTLPHLNVVRELSQIGSYTGAQQTLRVSRATDLALRTAILVQSGAGGPIIAAAKL